MALTRVKGRADLSYYRTPWTSKGEKVMGRRPPFLAWLITSRYHSYEKTFEGVAFSRDRCANSFWLDENGGLFLGGCGIFEKIGKLNWSLEISKSGDVRRTGRIEYLEIWKLRELDYWKFGYSKVCKFRLSIIWLFRNFWKIREANI